jgi:malonyl-CoA decarboxylase
VARFHLNNGAKIHEVHSGADTSGNGLRKSFGCMVNYLYEPGRIEQNHEAYASAGMVAASSAITGLDKQFRQQLRQRAKVDGARDGAPT